MARASTRITNRSDSGAAISERARTHYAAPSLRADATDAPERAAMRRAPAAAPAGSIAAIELALGF